MKNLFVLTLIANFLIPHSEVMAISCDEAKLSLVDLQRKENAMTNEEVKSGEDLIQLEKLKEERNKMLAKLMLLDGVEANIEQFNASLEKISTGEGMPTLKAILDNDAESTLIKGEGEDFSELERNFAAHFTAMEDIKVAHDLVSKFNPTKFATFATRAWDSLMPEGEKLADLSGKSADEITAIDQRWKEVKSADLARVLREQCQNEDFRPESEVELEGRDFCLKIDGLYSGEGANEKTQQMVEGYLGVMKHLTGNPRRFQDNQTARDSFHQALVRRIENQLPNTASFLSDDSYKEQMEGLQADIKAVSEKVPLLKKALKLRARCRLQGVSAKTCAQHNYALTNTELSDVNALQANYNKLQEYLTKYTNASRRGDIDPIENDQLLAIEKKLDGVEKLLGVVTTSDSETNKLLNAELGDLKVHDSNKAFVDYFANGERKQCFETLMKQLGKSDSAEFLNSELMNLLGELSNELKDHSDSCNINATSMSLPDFNKDMVACLMDLREGIGQSKIKKLKDDLNKKISAMDGDIKKITDSAAFQNIQSLKSIALNALDSSCGINFEEKIHTLECKVGDVRPADQKLLEIAGQFINIADIDTEQSVGGNSLRRFDDNVTVSELCVGQAGNEAIAKNNPLCRRANSRIRLRARNTSRLRQLEARNRKYVIVDRDRSGRATYKRRDTGWEMAGKSAIHVAPTWVNFYMTKLGQDAYIDAETARATYLTRWYQSYKQHPYSAQLGSLHQRMTFHVQQQPVRFA